MSQQKSQVQSEKASNTRTSAKSTKVKATSETKKEDPEKEVPVQIKLQDLKSKKKSSRKANQEETPMSNDKTSPMKNFQKSPSATKKEELLQKSQRRTSQRLKQADKQEVSSQPKDQMTSLKKSHNESTDSLAVETSNIVQSNVREYSKECKPESQVQDLSKIKKSKGKVETESKRAKFSNSRDKKVRTEVKDNSSPVLFELNISKKGEKQENSEEVKETTKVESNKLSSFKRSQPEELERKQDVLEPMPSKSATKSALKSKNNPSTAKSKRVKIDDTLETTQVQVNQS